MSRDFIRLRDLWCLVAENFLGGGGSCKNILASSWLGLMNIFWVRELSVTSFYFIDARHIRSNDSNSSDSFINSSSYTEMYHSFTKIFQMINYCYLIIFEHLMFERKCDASLMSFHFNISCCNSPSVPDSEVDSWYIIIPRTIIMQHDTWYQFTSKWRELI